MFFNFYVLEDFLFFLLLIDSWRSLGSDDIYYMISTLNKYAKVGFMTHDRHFKKKNSVAVWSVLYYMSVRLEKMSVLFSTSITLLTSYLLILSITRRGMLSFQL